MISTRRLVSAVIPTLLVLLALGAIGTAFVVGLRAGGAAPGSEAPAAAGTTPTVYTCSMHPQVRTENPDDRCPICFMELIPVGDAAGEDTARGVAVDIDDVRRAGVRTAVARREFPQLELALVGRVAVDETRVSRIAAYYPGRIERLYVDYTGVTVRPDDHLAEIYSPELVAAVAELREADRGLATNRQQAASLQAMDQAMVDAGMGRLRRWGLTEGQIESLRAGEPAERTTIYSPIGGIVMERLAAPGDYVQTGDPIVTVADLTRVWVRIEAHESQLPWIRFGQRVRFATDALPAREFWGRVSFIDPLVDPTTRIVHVRVNAENGDGALKPGMFVRARLQARVAADGKVFDPSLVGRWISPMHPEVVKDGPGTCDVCGMDLVPAESLGYREEGAGPAPVVIPASAPLITGERSLVYVETQRVPPRYEAREVRLGARAGDVYLVAEGLEAGERVVVEGAFTLDSEMQIRGERSLLQPPSAPPARTGAHDHGPPASLPGRTRPEGTVPAEREDGASGAAAVPEASALDSAVSTSGEPLPAELIDAYLRAWRTLATDDLAAFVDIELEALNEFAHWLGVSPVPDRSADIDAARRRFEEWSIALLGEPDRIPAGPYPLVRVHCPMAFDFSGADWIQDQPEILNPYFGAEMLRCGEVVGAVGTGEAP